MSVAILADDELTQRGYDGPVTDVHIHINPWTQLRPSAKALLKDSRPGFDQVVALAKDPRRLLRLMDEQGIERVGLVNYVAPEVIGYTEEVNDWVADYAREDRSRLLPFGSIDPHARGSTRRQRAKIEDIVSRLEVAAFKVHPPHTLVQANDYAAGAGSLHELYEVCQDQNVPVMVHTGTTVFPGARNRFGDPMALDDVAVDFPRLKIIMAHGGRPLWTETAFFLMRRHPNLWLDISSIPPSRLLDYFPRLEKIGDRVLYGSDWPGPGVASMAANVQAIRDLPISASTLRGILHDNSKRLFPVHR